MGVKQGPDSVAGCGWLSAMLITAVITGTEFRGPLAWLLSVPPGASHARGLSVGSREEVAGDCDSRCRDTAAVVQILGQSSVKREIFV